MTRTRLFKFMTTALPVAVYLAVAGVPTQAQAFFNAGLGPVSNVDVKAFNELARQHAAQQREEAARAAGVEIQQIAEPDNTPRGTIESATLPPPPTVEASKPVAVAPEPVVAAPVAPEETVAAPVAEEPAPVVAAPAKISPADELALDKLIQDIVQQNKADDHVAPAVKAKAKPAVKAKPAPAAPVVQVQADRAKVAPAVAAPKPVVEKAPTLVEQLNTTMGLLNDATDAATAEKARADKLAEEKAKLTGINNDLQTALAKATNDRDAALKAAAEMKQGRIFSNTAFGISGTVLGLAFAAAVALLTMPKRKEPNPFGTTSRPDPAVRKGDDRRYRRTPTLDATSPWKHSARPDGLTAAVPGTVRFFKSAADEGVARKATKKPQRNPFAERSCTLGGIKHTPA